MISGTINLHYDSALFMDPEIVKMGRFLGPESTSLDDSPHPHSIICHPMDGNYPQLQSITC